MADEIKNVFISHIHEDDDGLPKLKDLVATQGLAVREDPEYIKHQILAPQIEWASTARA